MNRLISLSLLAFALPALAAPQQVPFSRAVDSTLHRAADVAQDAFGRVRKAEKWAVEGLVRSFDEVTTEGITCTSIAPPTGHRPGMRS